MSWHKSSELKGFGVFESGWTLKLWLGSRKSSINHFTAVLGELPSCFVNNNPWFLIWPVGSWWQEVAVCSPWETHKCMFVKSGLSTCRSGRKGTSGLYKEGLAFYARSVISWNGWKRTWRMRRTQPLHQNQNSAIHYASAQNVGQHKRLEYSFCKKNRFYSWNISFSCREIAFILPSTSVSLSKKQLTKYRFSRFIWWYEIVFFF